VLDVPVGLARRREVPDARAARVVAAAAAAAVTRRQRVLGQTTREVAARAVTARPAADIHSSTHYLFVLAQY